MGAYYTPENTPVLTTRDKVRELDQLDDPFYTDDMIDEGIEYASTIIRSYCGTSWQAAAPRTWLGAGTGSKEIKIADQYLTLLDGATGQPASVAFFNESTKAWEDQESSNFINGTGGSVHIVDGVIAKLVLSG